MLAGIVLAMLSAVARSETLPGGADHDRTPRILTVADALATSRLLTMATTTDSPILVSPDGQRYAAALVRGDLAQNLLQIQIVSGSLASLRDAARYRTVLTLTMSGLSGGDDPIGTDALTLLNPVSWAADNRHINMFWEDEKSLRQVVSIDMNTGKTEYLTRHPTTLYGFDLVGGTLLYSAAVARDNHLSMELAATGFAVNASSDMDALDLLRGHVGSLGRVADAWHSEYFVVIPDSPAPRKVTIVGGLPDSTSASASILKLSPNGRQGVIGATPGRLPETWDAYTNSFFKNQLADARQHPARSPVAQVLQLFLLDVATATARPLWSAPTPDTLMQVAWAPDGRSVLIGPTFLPVEQADAQCLAGDCIVEFDVANGRFTRLPTEPGTDKRTRIRWLEHGVAEITIKGVARTFAKHHGVWVQVVRPAAAARPTTPIHVEVRQDLNTPPALYAVDEVTQQTQLVLDPNPEFVKRFALGKVEHVGWTTPEGRNWSGLLYYPSPFKPGKRYPLVIQTHGHAPPNTFSLYGYKEEGLGPGAAPFAAQPLSGRGIAVLHMEDQFNGVLSTPREAEIHVAAYEAAARHWAEQGLIDPAKVGLVGWSRTGFHVEYALAHSEFPFAAAVVADNFDSGYVQAALLGWPDYYSSTNGSLPFGDGLQAWLRHAPAFSADHVRAPLQIQSYTGPYFTLYSGWEMFSRLRALKKPTEVYVVPDGAHAGHVLQNPRQCLASQERAVDWFDFWLNGHEDAAPEKAAQYAAWRQMRDATKTNHSGGCPQCGLPQSQLSRGTLSP